MKALISILILSFSCSALYAQQEVSRTYAEGEKEVETFLQEFLPKFATATGEQAARVVLITTAEKNAENNLKRISAEREKYVDQIKKAEQVAAIMRTRVYRHGGAQSIDTAAYEEYEESLQRVAAVKSSSNAMAVQEQEAREKLEQLGRERQAAEEKRIRLEKQRDTVEQLYRAWKKTFSEEDFKNLTGYVTVMASEQNEKSEVSLATVDQQKNETRGAVIYYESELARKNKETPKSSSCTTGCTEKDMPKGWYYMWSVRGGRETSSRDRYIHIKGPTDKVEISENP